MWLLDLFRCGWCGRVAWRDVCRRCVRRVMAHRPCCCLCEVAHPAAAGVCTGWMEVTVPVGGLDVPVCYGCCRAQLTRPRRRAG